MILKVIFTSSINKYITEVLVQTQNSDSEEYELEDKNGNV